MVKEVEVSGESLTALKQEEARQDTSGAVGRLPTKLGPMLSGVQQHVIDFEAALSQRDITIAALRSALSDFLENPDFQVAVGGNPMRVEQMLNGARAALSKVSQ